MASAIENTPVHAPELGDAYHRARRSYGLFSALLLAWELVGIELTEAPVENLSVTFKTPEAAPYVLIVLVAYFGLRFTLEWLQSHPDRRSTRVSKIDFRVAHFIGASALCVFTIQRAIDQQLFGVLALTPVDPFVITVFATFIMTLAIQAFMRWRNYRRSSGIHYAAEFVKIVSVTLFGVATAVNAVGAFTYLILATLFYAIYVLTHDRPLSLIKRLLMSIRQSAHPLSKEPSE